jgi:hypothetical protein
MSKNGLFIPFLSCFVMACFLNIPFVVGWYYLGDKVTISKSTLRKIAASPKKLLCCCRRQRDPELGEIIPPKSIEKKKRCCGKSNPQKEPTKGCCTRVLACNPFRCCCRSKTKESTEPGNSTAKRAVVAGSGTANAASTRRKVRVKCKGGEFFKQVWVEEECTYSVLCNAILSKFKRNDQIQRLVLDESTLVEDDDDVAELVHGCELEVQFSEAGKKHK